MCAALTLGCAWFLFHGRSDDHPAPFPLITGEPGPLPYDQKGEPRVFLGVPDEYDKLWKVYRDCLGEVNHRIHLNPSGSKEDVKHLSEYQNLVYDRKYGSEEALKQIGTRIRTLEEQLHRARLNPRRLWHTGLMNDEQIAREIATVLKERRAHEIIFRLGSDLVDIISIDYTGSHEIPMIPDNRLPSYQ